MVLIFGDVASLHFPTSFLSDKLVGVVEIDPQLSKASTSNQVVSTDISDARYMCDTPLTQGASGCGCAVGSKGLVGDGGRTFPGSSLNANGSTTLVSGPLGYQGVNGVPHPAFRFGQKVTDVALSMKDVTIPGQERDIWSAKFRLTGPDGSLGSDYLPSSEKPLNDDVMNTPFHKLCAAVNSYRQYKLHIEAGGEAPIQQNIFLKAKIFQPTELIDPRKAGGSEGGEVGDSDVSMKATGPRMFVVDGKSPATDTAPAVRPSYLASKSLRIPTEMRGFPSVTSTSFQDTSTGEEDQCCQCAPAPKNPPGCHKPPTVTIHFPRNDMMGNFF
jgi:hypothetical protein